MDLIVSAASDETNEEVKLLNPVEYEGIYGKSLKALEVDWLAQIQSGL